MKALHGVGEKLEDRGWLVLAQHVDGREQSFLNTELRGTGRLHMHPLQNGDLNYSGVSLLLFARPRAMAVCVSVIVGMVMVSTSEGCDCGG